MEKYTSPLPAVTPRHPSFIDVFILSLRFLDSSVEQKNLAPPRTPPKKNWCLDQKAAACLEVYIFVLVPKQKKSAEFNINK